MFKKMREGFEGRLREIQEKARASAVELMNELCDHLQQIGVNATVQSVTGTTMGGVFPGSADFYLSLSGMLVGNVVGRVKVEDRNIDSVQVETVHPGGWVIGDESNRVPFNVFNYHYVVQANVEGLENRLNAEVKPITKGFLSKEVVDFRWEGGQLAQRLNADSELRDMLLKEGLDKLPNIEVRPHQKPRNVPGIGKPPQDFLEAQASFKQCVRITKRPKIPSNSEARQMFEVPGIPVWERKVGVELPTQETFETYERIAQHIHNIMKTE